MGQKSYYAAESYDLAVGPSTFSTSNGTQAFTAGVTFYTRLDYGGLSLVNGDLDVLWAPGSGTAPVAAIGLYFAEGTAAAGSLFQIGSYTGVGALAAGVIHKNVYGAALPFQNPEGVLYAALLVVTEAGTNKCDFGRLTAPITLAAYDGAMEADPTGQLGFPRAMKGAGTGLTALPASETLSGVTTTDFIFYARIS